MTITIFPEPTVTYWTYLFYLTNSPQHKDTYLEVLSYENKENQQIHTLEKLEPET